MIDRFGVKLGGVAGLVGISCCVTPVVLVLLGLGSVSFAISLGNTLYYQYGWYFRGAAFLLAFAGIYIHLKRRGVCSLRGAKSQWRMIAAVFVSMVVVYGVLYALTTYLGQIYS